MDDTIAATLRMAGRARSDARPLDFETFYRNEHGRLFRALWLLTRHRQEAEELMQEAFLRLWERWGRLSTSSDRSGYLYRTALNLWRSRLRRLAVAARKATHRVGPADEMLDVEARDAVVRSLAGLPARQRAAIVLTDVLDLSSDTAGAILGIRPVTVRVLAARARATLAREIGANDD